MTISQEPIWTQAPWKGLYTKENNNSGTDEHQNIVTIAQLQWQFLFTHSSEYKRVSQQVR